MGASEISGDWKGNLFLFALKPFSGEEPQRSVPWVLKLVVRHDMLFLQNKNIHHKLKTYNRVLCAAKQSHHQTIIINYKIVQKNILKYTQLETSSMIKTMDGSRGAMWVTDS